jgi:hypothetical protein
VEKGIERPVRAIVPFRPFALTRSSHVKDINLVPTDKLADQSRRIFIANSGRIDEQMRALLPHAKLDRLLRAASQLARINDDGPIGVFDVLQGSLGETAAFQLPHWIAIWNPPEFIKTSSWTPTAGLDSVLQRNIKRRAINACLSARNDFHVPSTRSVTCRNNVRTFHHQDDRAFRRPRAVSHAFGNNEPLPRRQVDYAIFKVD